MRHCAKITLLSMLLGIVGLPSGAAAQGWLGDRQASQGPGFQTGPLTLHMGFGAEFGYDSNVYLEDTSANDSLLMRLTAHLRATTRQEEETNPVVVFNGGVHASFFHFFADSGRDNVGSGPTWRPTFAPTRRCRSVWPDRFTRSIRPFVDGLPSPRYARDTNVVDAELRFRSDSDVLRAFIGYQLAWDFFEDRGPGEFAYAGSLTHAIRTGVYWAFLAAHGLRLRGAGRACELRRTGRRRVAGVRRVARPPGSGPQRRHHPGRLCHRHGWLLVSSGFFDSGAALRRGRDALTARIEGRFQPRDNLQLKVGYQRASTSRSSATTPATIACTWAGSWCWVVSS